MKNNITDNILDKIKDKKPKSRFSFFAKNYAFWIAGIISILIGALTVSVMIFIFVNHEWALAGRAGGIFKNLVYVLPYFWLAIFILFVIIAYYEIRHVQGGYKIALPIIIGVYIVSTFLLGFGFYKVGMGHEIEERFVEHAPFYDRMVEPRQKLFLKPEEGLLIGKVLEITRDDLLLLDVGEKEWEVDIREAHIPQHIKKEMLLDKMIVIFGETTSENTFEAEGIRPHLLPGKGPGMMKGVRGMKEMREGVRIIQ